MPRPQNHPSLVRDINGHFGHILGMLVHTNGIVSCKMHFWISAIGGNKHKRTNVSLCAEVWESARLLVEQEQNLYFSKIRGCGMFYALYIFLCSVDI